MDKNQHNDVLYSSVHIIDVHVVHQVQTITQISDSHLIYFPEINNLVKKKQRLIHKDPYVLIEKQKIYFVLITK